MLTNDDLKLSADQLSQYNTWAKKVSMPLWDADCAESHAITISFTFSSIGRTVEAVVDGSGQKLMLECWSAPPDQ